MCVRGGTCSYKKCSYHTRTWEEGGGGVKDIHTGSSDSYVYQTRVSHNTTVISITSSTNHEYRKGIATWLRLSFLKC